MNCSSCNTEIPVDERFCRNCGRPVEWVAPTIYGGAAAPPQRGSRPTEKFYDPTRTESLNPPAPTVRGWTPPAGQSLPPASVNAERRSLLMPIAVASIVIALVSIGALAYVMMSKDKVAGPVPPTQEKPTPNASPSVSSSVPSPTPTVQPTPTPTPSPTATPTPANAPPPGARLGYCNDTNVFVRRAPDLNAKPLTKITRGQKLWIIAASTNYSTWNGVTSNWTQVQIYNGSVRGWVFTPFVSY